MALVRILVDGYSLLHQWPELAEGKARHSEAARDELIQVLAGYQDASHTPVTVVFDGNRTSRDRSHGTSPTPVEVIFSREHQSADDVIERVVHRLVKYGEVMVVTDDVAEQQTVFGFGGTPVGCGTFIQMLGSAKTDLEEDLQTYNQKQRKLFRRPVNA